MKKLVKIDFQIDKRWGATLRKFREATSHSQRSISRITGWSNAMISDMETGKSPIPHDFLLWCLNFYGKSFLDFIAEIDKLPPPRRK